MNPFVNLLTFEKNKPIVQFEIGDMKNFIYLVLDWKTKTAAIVDPQKDLTGPLKVVRDQGFTLTSILLTHTHYDHTAGVGPLLKLYPELELKVGHEDLHRLPKTLTEIPGLQVLGDEEDFQVGDLWLKAIHTPGHSRGAFTFFIPATDTFATPYVLTGDTIFIRDCGRTDFDTGSNDEMFESIQKMKKLPPETVLLVGHHYAKEYASTIEIELKESPPFQAKSVDALAALP